MSESGALKVEWQDDHVVATLNRPERRNAINPEITEGLSGAIDEASERGAGAMVVTGGEDLFCVGADLMDASSGLDDIDPEQVRASMGRAHALYARIESAPLVVIAAIGGYALGGGLELALACDLRIASTNARFGFPEVRLGVLPGGGGTQRILRHVPRSKALELLVTGERFDAEAAHALGIVDRLADGGTVLDHATKLAEEIGSGPPLAVAAIKDVLRRGAEEGLAAGLQAETDAAVQLMGTDDAKEGIMAFVEKRPPKFRGR